jgi:hypothetical protein
MRVNVKIATSIWNDESVNIIKWLRSDIDFDFDFENEATITVVHYSYCLVYSYIWFFSVK